MRRSTLVGMLVLAVSLSLCTQATRAGVIQVVASAETDPVPSGDDAADDPAIWIHPSDPGRSTVIGTDKTGGGLAVYDLAGNELQYDGSVRPNNVDLRYGFPLGGASVDLVGFSNTDGGTIGTYVVDPGTRLVEDVAAGQIEPGLSPSGFCLYRSGATGRFFAFVVSSDGEVEQWRLFDNGSGRVDGELVRSFDNGGESEGCVADDLHGDLYVSEESGGIWKYGAEPGGGDARILVDETGSNGHLTADVEGLAIYQTSGGDGYLLASSQGNDSFVIYERRSNDYVGTFEVVDGAIDGVSDTDGIEVTNAPLGLDFSEGLFVAQDGSNPSDNQNFKYVPWGAIARSFDPRLTIDTDFDPSGDGGGGPDPRRDAACATKTFVFRRQADAEAFRDGILNDDALLGIEPWMVQVQDADPGAPTLSVQQERFRAWINTLTVATA